MKQDSACSMQHEAGFIHGVGFEDVALELGVPIHEP